MDPVGGSGSGSGSGSGQGTGRGKHPASPGECQGSPKRVKPDVDTIDETCSRAGDIVNLLWDPDATIMQTYNHDYSRSWDHKQIGAAGWEIGQAAQDMNRLCPELEGLLPDSETLRGYRGNFDIKSPTIAVANQNALQPDWETNSSQNAHGSNFVNSYSRDSKAFVISSAQHQLWQHGIPSNKIPAQASPDIRWADIAYYDWARPMHHPKKWFVIKPSQGATRLLHAAPSWFLIKAAATSPDTKPVTKYCLDFYGMNELPVWPKILTFPAGSYCYSMLLGTASSAEVAQFLISRRGVLGHQVLLSVTIYATSDDKKQDAPNLLWQTANFEPQFDRIRQVNGGADFPETPDGFPHMLKPLPAGQGA
ncbi:hypothetical protein CKM354_001218600 [Cercospora kikuchii]|uniref:Uncharacterized protein n=1 Tax=Cercospora kikuchii TaxID=84275 RepID=A0A9P3L1H1_9PEZI|nr:uncharacterized protein CKM354_001218600 [Cercospora kikuchii]GIZ49150.1 hypothetical protein CKM354_001218600 [Cercospora kikuchii]